MACSASDLVSLTPALNGVPIGLVPFAQLAVLCRILQSVDPMASCDAADLVDNAKCLSTCVPPGLVQYAALYLLCQIQTGGGTGSGSLTIGSGNPEGVVTATTGARYWDDTGGGFYTKTTASGNTGWQAE